jgi:Domain of unknown function (DUF4276)
MDLISKLPSRLKGYRSWIADEYKIVVLVDRDDDNCIELKNKLEKIATDVGLVTKSSPLNQSFQVLIRMAIEELEAWYFGDVNAIAIAYPGVSKNLNKNAKYRIPDRIQGGTWEALERILQKAGYHKGGLEKLKAAREISLHMKPENNCSESFKAFYQGLLELTE